VILVIIVGIHVNGRNVFILNIIVHVIVVVMVMMMMMFLMLLLGNEKYFFVVNNEFPWEESFAVRV